MRRRKFLGGLVIGSTALATGVRLNGQTPSGEGPTVGTKDLFTGLPGSITVTSNQPMEKATPLPPDYASPDANLELMAGWALQHLIHNPRPALNYEPVFYIRPLHAPPTLEGHDPIVPGDTDCRMDWEFMFMREITGSREGLDVQERLRRRILEYVSDDGLAWVTPGARMEGQVYGGKEVPQEKEAWPWSTAKILRSLSETYIRAGDTDSKEQARKMFVALRGLASWDSGRAYYAGSPWQGNKQIGGGPAPATALEPIVRYWEATGDPEALEFANDLAEGMIASAKLEAPLIGHASITSRLLVLPNGEFHGHMHSTLNAIWGAAHLGVATHNARYVGWSKGVYDYAAQFGTGTGWMSAALYDDGVREQSETCASSDMVSLASCIAQAGYPDYWDHVERIFRNYIGPFQFFVTPEYEAMYRQLNKEKPEEQVNAGLARMHELQGALWGGPAPNDRINWIASTKQQGPYSTPNGIAAIYGCCMAEGMRALYTIWSNIVTANSQGVFVNLSLNRESEWARVVSSLPDRGRIDVIARKRGDYYLRPPAWAPRVMAQVFRGGQEAPVKWAGPGMSYLSVKDVKPGEVLTLVYPLVTRSQTVGIWPSKPNLKFTIEWKGNSVVDMEPKSNGLPVNFANRAPVPPLKTT